MVREGAVGSRRVTVVRGWRWVWCHRCHVMWLGWGLECGCLRVADSEAEGVGIHCKCHLRKWILRLIIFGGRVWCEVRRGLRQPEGLNARGLRKEGVLLDCGGSIWDCFRMEWGLRKARS